MISVIIPVYNAEPYLDRCINSVLASSYSGFEIILVNDGSADGSPEICRKYARTDSRVRLFTQENLGVSSARNRGIKEARGEWIVFLDADDYISEDFLKLVAGEEYSQTDLLLFHFALQASACAPVSETGCPAAGSDRKTASDNPSCHAPAPAAEKTYFYQDRDMLRLIRRILVPGPLEENLWADFRTPCARAYRKTIIEDCSLGFSPDIRIGEDLLFNLEYQLRAGSCAYIPRTVYYYTIHADSSSHDFNPGLHENHTRLLTAVRETLTENGMFSSLEEDFYSYALENLTYVLIREIFSPLSPRKYRENRRLCREMQQFGIYRTALGYNRRCGILPRKILVYAFRRKCYPLTALISRISYLYLQRR